MIEDAVRLRAVDAARDVVSRPQSALSRLTAVAARVTHSRFAFLSLVAGDVEVIVSAAGAGGATLPASLPVEQSMCQHVVRDGRQLLVPDLAAHPAFRDLVEVRELGMRSYAGSPVLTAEGVVLGGLCVADDVVRQWSLDDALLLGDLAGAASSELSSQVLLLQLRAARDAERARADQQAALHRIASAVVRGELPQRVLQQAADELVRLLDARAALVLRFRPDGGTSVVVTAGPVAVTSQAWTWFSRVLEARGADGPPDDELPCAAVPIEVSGRTWGTLVLVLGPEGTRGRVEQLTQLADFLALVLVHAEAQLQLTRMARTDPLTGAANRRVFEERLTQELHRCRATGEQVLVALLDVDRFKRINDEHGHDRGDAVLRALTERIGEELGAQDLLARLGGDEWALLLPSPVDARDALERVRRAVAAEPLADVAVTVTVGGVLVDGQTTHAQALRSADAALYDAKARGRDRVVLA